MSRTISLHPRRTRQELNAAPMLIGLSLTQCIADIVNGAVSYSQVLKIYTSTAIRTEEDWDSLVYGEFMYDNWRRRLYKPYQLDQAIAVFKKLRAEGKIVQPRLTRGRAPLWRKRAWSKDERTIIWWRLH